MAGGAQPAGTDLGEAAEIFPSLGAAVQPPAAQPGTNAYTNPAAQVESAQRLRGAGT